MTPGEHLSGPPPRGRVRVGELRRRTPDAVASGRPVGRSVCPVGSVTSERGGLRGWVSRLDRAVRSLGVLLGRVVAGAVAVRDELMLAAACEVITAQHERVPQLVSCVVLPGRQDRTPETADNAADINPADLMPSPPLRVRAQAAEVLAVMRRRTAALVGSS